MKKYIKVLIIVITIISFLFILNKILEKPTDEKIIDYVIKQGYELDSKKKLYYKELSKYNLNEYNYYVSKKINSLYEINYFDNYNYKLIKEKLEYAEGFETSLIENYSYRDNSLTYTYRINNKTVNAIYKGTYEIDSKNFVCEKEFSYGLENNSLKNTICDKIEYDVMMFSLEAYTFISNGDFIDYIKNKEIE